MIIKKKQGSYMLDFQEAGLIVEVLNEGMPEGKIKRGKLAKLSNNLENKFEIEID